MKSALLGFASFSCFAQAYRIGVDVEEDETLLAPLVQTFSCDHECVKTEARLQGADVITSLDNIKYSMEVVFQDDNYDSGDACGKTNLRFPPYRVAANPSIGTKITTAETRREPSIVFECEYGKHYHMLMADALGGAFQNTRSYNHWLKVNMVCQQNGQAEVENNGRDVEQGTGHIPGWFNGKGYLPPAFPHNTLHHFGFYIWESDVPFTDAELDQIDIDFPTHNAFGPSAYLVEEVASFLKVTSPPVARTWVDVTTSYWSGVRMGRLIEILPAFSTQSFASLACPCNLASSFPGVGTNGASECNF